MIKKFFKLSWLLLLAGSCFTFSSALAQDQWENEGELEDVEIEIINERKITLPKANRNFEKVPPRPSESIKSPVQYDFKPFSFEAPQINPAIRPLRIKQDDPSKVTGGYLSAGYGNYASPYLEGFINSKKDKNKLVGAHALFSSSDKGPVDGVNSGSGMTLASVFARSFSEVASFSGDLGFENRTTHFYGYPEGATVEAKDIKQSYSLFKAKGAVANSAKADFSYNLGGAFSYLADKFDARETEVKFDFLSAYTLSDESRIGINALYDLLSRKDAAIETQARNLFQVTPSYQFEPIEDVRVSVGLTAAFENDSIDSKNVHAYPDVRVSYPVTPSIELLASLTGGIEKVSLQSLSNENIWIGQNIPIFHTNKLYDLQASLNTRIGNKVAVNGGFSIAALKNWYFFINDPYDQTEFIPIYDKEETTRTNFFASLGFSQAQSINVLVRGDLYSYGLDDRHEAWHRPTYRLTADGSFNIAKKILFNVKVISQGGAKANVGTAEIVELDPAFDLSAGIQYMLSEKFSVFVRANNITSNEYQVFINYPVRGLQVLGGLTWSF